MKKALAIVLLTGAIFSQGLPFYFDPLGNLGGSFSPLSIPDCGLWLDAADSSTVQLYGVSVTNWINKAVPGTSATVVGGTNTYPSFCTAELNGKCTVFFDGADYLSTSFLSATGTTVFVVAKMVSGEIIVGSRDSTSTRSMFGARDSSIRYMGAGVGGDSAVTSSVVWGSEYHIFSGKYDGNFVSLYDNGTNILTKAQSGSGANFSYGYYIGALNSLGTPLVFSSCYVGELICFRRNITDYERVSVEGYLRRKWFNQ